MKGLLLSDDLIFSSRVLATARAYSLDVVSARTLPQFLKIASETPLTGVILDLQFPGLDLPVVMAQLPSKPRVVAYGSHVAADRLQEARDVGCHKVLARSKFTKDLETHLGEWITPLAAESPSETP